MPALAKEYTVYLLDLPGFGTMRRFPRRFAIDEASLLILKWMEAVGIKHAPFIAHSMGGYISLWIASNYPDVVERLLLVAPAAVPYQKSVFGYVRPLVREIFHLRPSFAPILAYDALRAGVPTLLRAMRDLLNKDARSFLKTVQVPTLLIWGENDSLVPVVYADILHQEIVGSHLLVLKKAGHLVMFDQFRTFNDVMLAFLRGSSIPDVTMDTSIRKK